MKVKDIIDIIIKDGWFLVRQKGSHPHYKHMHKKGVVTITGKKSMQLHPKIIKSISKQANLDKE